MAESEIASVGELLEFAEALERAAAVRYRHLAEAMQERGRKDLAALFAGLAREEERHESWVRQRRRALAPEPTSGRRRPDVPGAAPAHADLQTIARMTPYACLAEAVRDEQKAFAFFSNLAAEARDPLVQKIAEDLAKQELEHASLLRKVRRRAYREARRAQALWPRAGEIDSRDALHRAARTGESEVFRLLGAACGPAPALAPVAQRLSEEARRLGLEGESPAPPEKTNGAPDPTVVAELLENAEAAFDFYDAVAAAAPDEGTMLQAQDLMRFALARLRLLREALKGA